MIEYRLTTVRDFKNFKDFEDYCKEMHDSGMFDARYWDQLLEKSQSHFNTFEPANKTMVHSKGRWTEKKPDSATV